MRAAQPKTIDWAKRADFETLFPDYRREQIRLEALGVPRSKLVEIKSFSLKNPTGSADIFLNTGLTLQPNKRCALYGVNGSGKTCLFEGISSGEIQGFPRHMHIHHMKELEHDEVKDAESVLDTVLHSHDYRNVLLRCEGELKKQMEESKDDAERTTALENNLEYVTKQLSTVHGDHAIDIATGMLRVLGFDEIGEKAPLSSLSGGLRMRVALACAFFINPDLLLLDEPTNHLDLPSVLWLENKLRGYKGSFLLVTHDRTLLENVVTSVLLIQDLKLLEYAVTFKEFEIQKEKDDNAREKQIENFMRMHRNIDGNNPKYKIKMNYEKWLTARHERGIQLQGKFTFQAPPALACPEGIAQRDVSLIKVENLRFSYQPDKLPFIFDNPISYNFTVGTRVGIMGPNGAGKSTLLKLITGHLEATNGTIERHPDFITAYFGQHSTKELDLNKSALEFMKFKFPKEKPAVLKGHLAKTSVGDSIVDSHMKDLSFSQRSCVIFAALTFVPPHLLIMDEPTNFLDLDSVDSLIKAVNKFTGGLILVTHNRDFLSRTAKTFLSIIPGAFLEFETVKDAERATYSFITALENGQFVDFQAAIKENRGGGAAHTDKEQAARKARLTMQQKKISDELAAVEAEKARVEGIAAERERVRLAKLALLKTDWAADEACWANIKGKWVQATVVRNVPGMGVTVKLASTGDMSMVDSNKLRSENPEAGGASAGGASRGGAAGARGGAAGGRGASAGGASRGGSYNNSGRGGATGGRGGAATGGRGGASGGRGASTGGARGGRGRGQ